MSRHRARNRDQATKLLASMKERRGYLLPFHQLLAKHDPNFLESYDALLDAAFLAPRVLDRRTKELVLVGILTAISAPPTHTATHIRAAIAAGASDQELLEALELVLPAAGVARFMEGVEQWQNVVTAKKPKGRPRQARRSS